jgi:hypothetical protein
MDVGTEWAARSGMLIRTVILWRRCLLEELVVMHISNAQFTVEIGKIVRAIVSGFDCCWRAGARPRMADAFSKIIIFLIEPQYLETSSELGSGLPVLA